MGGLVKVPPSIYFSHSLRPYCSPPSNTANSWLHLPVRVAGTWSKAKGKFDTSDKNVLIELSTLMTMASTYAGPAFLSADVRARLSNIDPSSIAEYVYANMLPDRAKPCAFHPPLSSHLIPSHLIPSDLSSNFDAVRRRVVSWAGPLIYAAGISQVDAALPVASGVESYQFFALFLGLLLNLIAIILLALCAMLIGSLLLVSVETRYGCIALSSSPPSHIPPSGPSRWVSFECLA